MNAKRLLVLYITLVFISSSFVFISGDTESYVADTKESTANRGFITASDPTDYYKALNGTGTLSNTTSFITYVGQFKIPASENWFIYRSYSSYNTSGISTSDQILSAEIFFKSNNPIGSEASNVQIYNTNYGASLTNDDWNATKTFENTLMDIPNYGANAWYSCYVSTSNINRTGTTQYVLKSGNEGQEISEDPAIFWSGNSTPSSTANQSYLQLSIKTSTGATVTHNFTASGMVNRTSNPYPMEVIEWNNTHEQLRYEIFSTNQSYINLTLDGNTTYQSIHPYANITDLGNGVYNITETYDNIYYNIWFLREKFVYYSDIHISLYHSTIGEGFFWEKWKVYINDGLTYDNTTATKVFDPNYIVEYGDNYTLTVLDYFNNVITSYQFVANSFNIDIEIPIDVYTFASKNLRRDSTLMRIYFNGTGNPFTQQLSIDELYKIPIRAGTYMIVYTYLTTQSNLTTLTSTNVFYNLTFDGDYTAYIGEDIVQLDHITVDGMEVTVGTILTSTSPYVNIDAKYLPRAPTLIQSFDNTALSDLWPFVGQGTRALNYAHTYAIYEAHIQEEYAGTTANLWDPKPTGGNTTIKEDTLSISTEFSTNIMLNYTNGTNYLNYSNNPGKINLAGKNLTMWANNTFYAMREVKFNHAGIFTWTIDTFDKEYGTTLALNNTSPFDYTDLYWYVPLLYKSEIDINETDIFDMTNNLYLVFGSNYSVSLTGFHFDYDVLPSGVSLPYTFSYKVKNETPSANSPIKETIKEYDIVEENGVEWVVATVTVSNPYTSVYDGDVWLKLDFDKANYMDVSTLKVKQINPDQGLSKDDISPQGISILIDANSVGDLGVGETVSYEIKFQTISEPSYGEDEIWSKQFTFAGIPFSILSVMLISVFVLGMFTFFRSKKEDKTAYIMITAVAFFGYILVTLLAGSGL